MLKKLFNFYIRLYVEEDKKNQKPRSEIRRLCFLTINIFCITIFSISFFTTVANVLGRLLGIIK